MRTSLCLEYLGKLYKVAHIESRTNGNVLIFLPRSSGYLLKHLGAVDLSAGSQAITFNNKAADNPRVRVAEAYITFHPGKGNERRGVIHMNAKDLELVGDSESAQLSDLANKKEFVPLVTIIIPPNPLMFDRIEKVKSEQVDIFRKSLLSSSAALAAEVFIHSKRGYIDKDSLLFADKRKVLKIVPFENTLATDIMVTLVYSVVPHRQTQESNELVVFIWSKNDPTAVGLEANPSSSTTP
jgi:hypothetical protein